ncbi:MAG TPA: acyl-CoA dehydrogenase family protein [Candidatus Dormibacteraeota bacterium]|nr:acyl-CoA dehydrogenase family protein [Candidatus Dormibacteraeota bacterium]
MSVGSRPAADAAELLAGAGAVADVLAGQARAVDEAGAFPRRGMETLRGSGLMGLLVPREHGGLAGSCAQLAEVGQVLAGGCLSTAMVWGMHCQQVAVLVDHAHPRLRDRVLPAVARGEVFIASITSERGKGGHLLTAYAPLTYDDGAVVMRREAPVVTGGAHADAFLTTMRASPDAPPNAVKLVYADRAQVAVEERTPWSTLGMRGTESVGIGLEGRVPAEQIVDADRGFEEVAVTTLIPVGHIAWASCWLGAATSAYRQVIALLRDPRQRREFDLHSDLFVTRLAEIRMRLDVAGAYLHRVVAEYDDARRRPNRVEALYAPAFQIHINTLKVHVSQSLFRAVDDLMQLVGLRHGYSKAGAVPVERVFRDLRSASLMYSNDRLLIANGKLSLLDGAVTLP